MGDREGGHVLTVKPTMKGLLNGDRSSFRYLAVRFDALLPMVVCGAFHVEYDLERTPLQRRGHGDAQFEVITLTVTLANISVMAR